MIGTIDLVVIAVVIISVIFALYRGLLRELLGITSWILAGLGALWSYDPFLKFFDGKVDKVQMWTIISTVLVALVILVVMTLLNSHVSGKLRKSSLSGLDRILGCLFGVLRAALLIVLVWMVARHMMFSPKKMQELNEQNKVIPYMDQGADWLEKLLPESIQRDMKSSARKGPVKVEKPQYSDKDKKKLEEMINSIVEVEVDE